MPLKDFFLTKGVGKDKDPLISLENALRNAGIDRYVRNIVDITYIPPECKYISNKDKVLEQLMPGEIVYVVMAKNSTNEPNRLIAASIGVANYIETDDKYLSVHLSSGQTDKVAGEYAEDMAAKMLMSSLYIEHNSNGANGKKDIQKRNMTQSAIGDKDGLSTTVITSGVFRVEGRVKI
jgi:arginine decarboxylase